MFITRSSLSSFLSPWCRFTGARRSFAISSSHTRASFELSNEAPLSIRSSNNRFNTAARLSLLSTATFSTTSNNAAALSSSSPSSSSSSSRMTATATRPAAYFKSKPKTSVKFTVGDGTGSLSSSLQWFGRHSINMTRIESRPNKRSSEEYDFFIDFVGTTDDEHVKALLTDLRLHTRDVQVLSSRRVPWFPRRLRDLDQVAAQVLDAGAELQSDHPGFQDLNYRNRRREVSEISEQYRQGDKIPRIHYTKDEVRCWSTIYNKLMPLAEKHACAEYNRMLPLLQANCGYSENNVPQLQDISEFLKECTGVTLRPVTGLLSSRNFLYGLAFRVFFSTQYLRHHSKPLYTPEPDIVHELIGHVPLFADQAFADFSQEIGLASLGASDEQITELARCYWFSVEFGLCQQNGERKAYGAGLLSSFGEMEWAMSSQPTVLPFDPFVAAKQEFPITTYQPLYFQAESFETMKQQMQSFAATFARPFNVRYDPYTQTIDVDGNIQPDEQPPTPVKKIVTTEPTTTNTTMTASMQA